MGSPAWPSHFPLEENEDISENAILPIQIWGRKHCFHYSLTPYGGQIFYWLLITPLRPGYYFKGKIKRVENNTIEGKQTIHNYSRSRSIGSQLFLSWPPHDQGSSPASPACYQNVHGSVRLRVQTDYQPQRKTKYLFFSSLHHKASFPHSFLPSFPMIDSRNIHFF